MGEQERGDVFERFRESLHKMEGHFHVLEQRVPVELQMEYFKCSTRMRRDNIAMTEEDFNSYKQNLSDSEATTDTKKHALLALAVSNEAKAYRILKEYAQHPEPDVTNWAYMALMESRISLASELSEEKQIYISTGLGGKGEKLRFYALFYAAEKKPFETYQRQIIGREFTYFLLKEDCEIERLIVNDVYVELLFLIPVSIDIKMALTHVVAECNLFGNFLSDIFTVTNVKELSAEEIGELVRKKYEDNRTGH
ncbi:MAG: hypothetical protein LBJ60_02820 [Tannerellaceae bacterium]|jgi:hypothetical protein|nr:hypothetical protein [Tannerellaceae bacterium]